MSAPKSNGRQFTGVAKVLSTISGTPCVCRFREPLDVEDGQGRIGDGLAEDRLGVRAECGVQLLVGRVGGDEREVDAHTLHRDGEEIERAAVNVGGGDDVIAGPGDIEHGEEVGGLPGGGQHGGSTALEGGDLRGDRVAGRVLQAGIEVAARFEVEEVAHRLACLVTEGRALHDGDLSRLPVLRCVATLHTGGGDACLFHDELLSVFGISFIFCVKKQKTPVSF